METVSKKRILITGASSGIGRAMALHFLKIGHQITAIARNKDHLEVLKMDASPFDGNLQTEVCNLASLRDLKSLTERLLSNDEPIDVLINNAGLVLSDRRETIEGFEMTMGVNHLAHFYMTLNLIPLLRKSVEARIIHTSSRAHQNANFAFEDPQMKQHYSGVMAYCNSKLANIWFSRILSQKLKAEKMSSNTFHPGVVRTGFAMDGDLKGLWKLFALIARPFVLSAKEGADTGIYLAEESKVCGETGKHFYKRHSVAVSDRASSQDEALRFWGLSEEWLSRAGFEVPLL